MNDVNGASSEQYVRFVSWEVVLVPTCVVDLGINVRFIRFCDNSLNSEGEWLDRDSDHFSLGI